MPVTNLTNCPNCGAPVDLAAKSCQYCGTPYTNAEPLTLRIDGKALAACVDIGIMTPNEARRLMGLPYV